MLRHLSLNTEKSYTHWLGRYGLFLKDPKLKIPYLGTEDGGLPAPPGFNRGLSVHYLHTGAGRAVSPLGDFASAPKPLTPV